tara:strand:- start:4646 stop:5644 length:999 start_codon:yes stop_codon:yes gene_type:complete
MKNIFITDYFRDSKIESKIFRNFAKVHILNCPLEKNLPRIINKADGLLVWHTNISAKTIKNLKKCKAIVRYGVGYDNIDHLAARKYGIDCANTPDYGTEEVADTAAAMILSLSRKIFHLNQSSKNYKKGWQQNVLKENLEFPIKRSNELKVGIIGLGRIGSSLSLRLKNFNMKIGFYDPYVQTGVEKILGIKKFNSLNDLISNTNIISINCVLTKETLNLVDRKFINKLNRGTIIVNTSRGKIINSLDDIYYGIKNKIIAGVGLDVLPEEPPSFNSKLIKLWKNQNSTLSTRILINPHSGYYSSRSVIEMREKASANLLNALKGKKIYNLIN